jgi:hypothetical protein
MKWLMLDGCLLEEKVPGWEMQGPGLAPYSLRITRRRNEKRAAGRDRFEEPEQTIERLLYKEAGGPLGISKLNSY